MAFGIAPQDPLRLCRFDAIILQLVMRGGGESSTHSSGFLPHPVPAYMPSLRISSLGIASNLNLASRP